MRPLPFVTVLRMVAASSRPGTSSSDGPFCVPLRSGAVADLAFAHVDRHAGRPVGGISPAFSSRSTPGLSWLIT